MSFFSKIASKVVGLFKGRKASKLEEPPAPKAAERVMTEKEARRAARQFKRQLHRQARLVVEWCVKNDKHLTPKFKRRPIGFRIKGGWRCKPVY